MKASPARSNLPVVAVVGRPNVGKSSLVNRVIGHRAAIVEPTPGVTRDRQSFTAEWAGRRFELVDTGGLEPGQHGLDARVAEQAQVAMVLADVIVLVVDAQTGTTQDDLEVADALRRFDKPVLVVANKVDDPQDEPMAASFHRLGLGTPLAMSALHGRGSGDFLDELVARLPAEHGDTDDAWASVAIVGRPNVGKSSLLNRLLGEERAIVDSAPGTTRDPVDSLVSLEDGRVVRIIDTAGMRREVKIDDPIEYFSFLRSRGTLARADAAILVVDAAEAVTSHDQRLAEAITEAGRACVIALNKWDRVPSEGPDRDRFDDHIRRRLRFLTWAPIVRTSAITGRGVNKLLPAVERALTSHRTRLPTAVVTGIVRDAQDARPHPRQRGRAAKILYALQAEVAPPTFVLFTSGRLQDNYLRYLEHRVRAVEAFDGTPITFKVRLRSKRPSV
ncbi:MAG: ribosome biogenesis GTPase Der [Actinobacteria bacterium]|nr:ribosome biogenesis GTPase Der [Actinomycetota bacterium]